MMKWKIIDNFLFCLMFLLAGCGGVNPNPTTKAEPSAKSASKDTSTPPMLGMVNPALKYCTDHGHKLTPVKDGSIVRYYLCINDSAHKKCSANAYYRGDCVL